MTFVRNHPWAPRILLYGAAAIVSAATFAYMQSEGIVNAFGDAKSHLLQSIQMVFSLTPGISQLGFWPPLLHVILLPAAILLPYPVLLVAGAYLTMLPLLLLGAYFLYGICRHSDVSPRLSLLAPALFVLHPFVQYFASSAMAELPLIVTVLGVAYYALRWSEKTSLLNLSLFGLFVSLATTARFEGTTLIPLSVAFVVLRCLELRMTFDQTKAIVLTFSFLAFLGMFFIILYSTVYAGSPLAFLQLGVEQVKAPEAVGGFSLASLGSIESIRDSVDRFVRASAYMHGRWLLALFPIATIAVLALRRRWHDGAILLFLVSPALFVLFMMSIRHNHIALPELPRLGRVGEPYKLFFNTRFAVTWVGGLIVAIVLGVDALSRRRFLRRLASYVAVPCILAAGVGWYATVLFDNHFYAVRFDEQSPGSLRWGSEVKEEPLLPEYDGGRVLFTRFYSEASMLYSDVPLSNFVYEGNYLYIDQAMREPWLFVRWVIVRHAVSGGEYEVDGVLYKKPPDPGFVQSVKIMRDILELEATPEFQLYYELVKATPYVRYYRLREHVLRDHALSLGYDPSKIPSLNLAAPWRPKTIYEELQGAR